MAHSLIPFGLSFLLLFSVCSCYQSQPPLQRQSQQRFKTQCQLQSLNAVEPKHTIKSEAGVCEFWDQNEEQFQCANVAPVRHRIHQKGLFLPSFNGAPQLFYVVEGKGIFGAVFPGCPETYQSGSQFKGGRQQSQPDQHQKLRFIRQGDIIALPAGIVHWFYNPESTQLVLVSIEDLGSPENQLDLNYRKFFLAGNPQEEVVTGGQRQSESREQSQGQSRRFGHHEQESNGNNILSGFKDILEEVLNVEPRLVKKLQNPNNRRGVIIRVEREFDITVPEREEEEQQTRRHQQTEEEEQQQQPRRHQQTEEEEEQQQPRSHQQTEEEEEERERPQKRSIRWNSNGIEETYCSMNLKLQIDNPSLADIFNPRGGRIKTANAYNLPILSNLQLSAEKGVLYRNGIYAPHWNVNAHSIIYITRGNGWIQIVRENGDSVFDDEVEEGQMIVAPQNFAVYKRAGNQGLEWVAFKTNALAYTNQIAGRNSLFRALPLDVLMNAYDISRKEASRLKQSRHETSVFSPFSKSQHPRA